MWAYSTPYSTLALPAEPAIQGFCLRDKFTPIEWGFYYLTSQLQSSREGAIVGQTRWTHIFFATYCRWWSCRPVRSSSSWLKSERLPCGTPARRLARHRRPRVDSVSSASAELCKKQITSFYIHARHFRPQAKYTTELCIVKLIQNWYWKLRLVQHTRHLNLVSFAKCT